MTSGRSGRTAGSDSAVGSRHAKGQSMGTGKGQGEGMTGGTISLTSTTSQRRCRAVGPIDRTRPSAAATPANSPAISVVSANHQSIGDLLTRSDALAIVSACPSRFRLRQLRSPAASSIKRRNRASSSAVNRLPCTRARIRGAAWPSQSSAAASLSRRSSRRSRVTIAR